MPPASDAGLVRAIGARQLTASIINVTIGAGIFLLAGVLAMGIAMFTVSFQAIRAAMANPVHSLRTE